MLFGLGGYLFGFGKGDCRTKIDSTRLLTLNAASMIDNVGSKNARTEISMIKIMAPRIACDVID